MFYDCILVLQVLFSLVGELLENDLCNGIVGFASAEAV